MRVWVPSDVDAQEIKAMAERMRAKAETLEELKEGIAGMDAEGMRAIVQAILEQGSPAYNTPSGPVLTLLSDIAARGDLRSFSNAFVAFARARPANAAYVEANVPARILNRYLSGFRGVTASQFGRWAANNPDWAQDLRDSVRDPGRFERTVEGMLEEIRAN